MRPALVILRKDLRRFWWEIAITLVPLAILSWLDAQRYDFVPGPMEALLTVFLPITWAYLVAVVIQEDGMAGGRQFWMARPISPASLALAKLLFIATGIHLPDFIADVIVVVSHGHSLVGSLAPLLWKQAVLAAVVTIPAAALASVTENLAQFFPAALALGVSVYLLAASKLHDALPWNAPDVRNRLTGLTVLLIAASGVIIVQYRFRRTGIARWLGGMAVVSGGLVFANIASQPDPTAHCDTVDSSIIVARTPGTPVYAAPRQGLLPTGVDITLQIKGLPEHQKISFEQAKLQAQTAGGPVWSLPPTVEEGAWRRPDAFMGQLGRSTDDRWTQMLFLGSEPYQQLRVAPFTLRGQAVLTLFDEREHPLQTDGRMISVPELGRCSAWSVEDLSITRSKYMTGGEPWLYKVYCESPGRIPTRVPVVLASEGRTWIRPLGDSIRDLGYPWQTWLSPLARRQTFYQLTDGPGDNWQVPRKGKKTFAIRTQKRTGCRVVSYELHDLQIGR